MMENQYKNGSYMGGQPYGGYGGGDGTMMAPTPVYGAQNGAGYGMPPHDANGYPAGGTTLPPPMTIKQEFVDMNGVGGGDDGDFNGDDYDEATQKHLSQREKNREAVRNCRKRKKEYAKQLKERMDQLVEENAKLRLELQLGGDHKPQAAPEPSSNEEEQALISEMVPLVHEANDVAAKQSKRKGGSSNSISSVAGGLNSATSTGPPRSDAEIALRRKVQVYMERHQDHGRDRQKAISFILQRLHRLVVPEDITKQYLNIMTSDGGAKLEGPEWSGLKEELQLTSEQVYQFAKRRQYAKRLRNELDCAFEKMQSIVQRCRRNKKLGDSLNELTTILKPEQFARFVVWVHTNPACKDILDELWGKLLAQCDLHINKEILSSMSAVRQIKVLQENSAVMAMHLFSVVDPRTRVEIAPLCCHPDVVLVDANNNVDKKGIRAVVRYMSYVTNAFDAQSCEKTKSLRALDVEEKSIVSDEDDKVTGTWRMSGVYMGKLLGNRKRKSPGGSTMESPPSAYPFGFGPGPAAGAFTLPAASSSSSSSMVGPDQDRSRARPYDSKSTSSSPSIGNSPRLPPAPTEPMLSKEQQKERTVSFNVIVEFSFGDPTKPELCTEMIISWDAISVVGQLGLLKSPTKGVLPPPGSANPALIEQQDQGNQQYLPQQEDEKTTAMAIEEDAPVTMKEKPDVGNKLQQVGEEETLRKKRKVEDNAAVETTAVTETPAPAAPADADAIQQDDQPIDIDEEEKNRQTMEDLASERRRQTALNLSKVFEAETKQDMETLAELYLDAKCMFDDIHMGAKYKGIPACLSYIRRIRRAFPKFEIESKVLSESKAQREKGSRPMRNRASSHGSTPSDSSSMASMSQSPNIGLGSPRVAPDVVEMKWAITGYYGGVLVKDRQACKIDGKVFITINPVTSKIMNAKLDIVAQDLMFQLGILRENPK